MIVVPTALYRNRILVQSAILTVGIESIPYSRQQWSPREGITRGNNLDLVFVWVDNIWEVEPEGQDALSDNPCDWECNKPIPKKEGFVHVIKK